MRFFRYVFLMWLPFIPVSFVHAGIIISEVMYDLEGSDTDREWIEIQNTGGEGVDISNWKFYEGASNHGLTLSQGNTVMAPGAFAIIADTPAKFLSDNPGFSGTLFDSSFSLSNTGETLTIRDGSLADSDSVTYSSTDGGAGNGTSLQMVNGSWVFGLPTPGALNEASAPPPASSGDNSSSNTSDGSQTTSGAVGSSTSVEQTIFPDAGEDKTVIAGASTLFEGEALGIKKEPLLNARYVWNFGDGEVAEGKRVMHTYRLPGEYTATLTVASGEHSISDRLSVSVIETPIIISAVAEGEGGYVEISNKSLYELDISWWQIFDGRQAFVFPENTFLLANKNLKISNAVSKIVKDENVSLLYPNGTVAYSYGKASQPLAASSFSAGSAEKTSQAAVAPRTPSAKSTPVKEAENNLNQVAGAADFEDKEGATSGSAKWYLALAGLVIFAVGGVIFIRAGRKSESGFTIVE